jgi:hypothetical protein
MLPREIISQKLFSTQAGAEFDIRNTLFFKILRANPLLARFYADLFRRHGANPSIIIDLETRSPDFFAPDQSTNNPVTEARTRTKKKGSNMAVNPNARVCSHIKVNGIRTPPKSRLHPIANFEDAQAIQASLMEVVNALVRNHIDVARARLILRALSIAARNAPKVRFDRWESEMVKEVPEYPAAPPTAGSFAIATAQGAALATISTPPEQESEAARPSSAFETAPADVHSNARRKPPASVKNVPRSRSARSRRSG